MSRRAHRAPTPLADADQSSLGDLDRFAVSLPGGGRVPLSAVVEVETSRGLSRIARVDGRRTVTVRGEVDAEATNLNEILARTQRTS